MAQYGFGLFRPTVFCFVFSLVTVMIGAVIKAIFIYKSIETPLRLGPWTVYWVTSIVAPIMGLQPLLDMVLQKYGSKYLTYQNIGMAYLLSTPVSLWAMSKVPVTELEDKRFAFHSAMRKTLVYKKYRVFYLLHLGFLHLADNTLSFKSNLCGLLSKTSSLVAYLGLFKYVTAVFRGECLPCMAHYGYAAAMIVGCTSLWLLESRARAIAMEDMKKISGPSSEKDLA